MGRDSKSDRENSDRYIYKIYDWKLNALFLFSDAAILNLIQKSLAITV